MESLRRPSVLAAIAAALLILNIALLSSDDEPGGVTGDPAATDTMEEQAADGEDATGDDGAENGDAAADDAGDGADDGSDGAATSGDSDDTTTDEADVEADGDGAGDAPGDSGAGLGTPTSGTYTYASGGSWSLAITGEPTEEYQLPATATAVVATSGDVWDLRLTAGDRYADEFGFSLGPDGGLDWVDWILERVSPNLGPAAVYTCSGDSAHYRPDEEGRVATHVCETTGITSTGSIEHTGTVDVTLGDGTVIAADQLLYTYTVAGDGVSGGGQLDIWLDPASGLRLKEVRTITTNGETYEYRENVEFTLQSLDPS